MSTRLRTIVIVSFALNLFFAGIFAGMVLRGGFMPPLPPIMQGDKRGPFGKPDFSGVLSPDKIALMEKIMAEDMAAQQDNIDRMRRLHDGLDDIIAADEFDVETFQTQVEKIDALQAAFFRGMGKGMGKFLSQLTPEERKAFAKHFRDHAPPPGFGPPPRHPQKP